jgi:hypothetical protein
MAVIRPARTHGKMRTAGCTPGAAAAWQGHNVDAGRRSNCPSLGVPALKRYGGVLCMQDGHTQAR